MVEGVQDQVVHRQVFLFTAYYLMSRTCHAEQNGFDVFFQAVFLTTPSPCEPFLLCILSLVSEVS